MKNNLIYILSFFTIFIHAQVVTGERQLSLNWNQVTKHIVLKKPDSNYINRIGSNESIAAVMIDSVIDFGGSPTIFQEGNTLVKLLKIKVKNAQQLNIYFSKFKLPPNSFLIIQNALGEFAGRFTNLNNNAFNNFAIRPLYGEEIMLEYRAPVGSANPEIEINQIGYFFREVNEVQSSSYCEVDVNCVEGDLWKDQTRGVVRLLFKEENTSSYCSGSLLNNTSRNCNPFIYSAQHCVGNSTKLDLSLSIAYFNYENSSCGSGVAFSDKTVLGLSLLASGAYDGGSDFSLMQLATKIPLEYQAYYNGWSLLESENSTGVAIHHPKGDVKKISTYNSELTTATVSDLTSSAYYEVVWNETTSGHGVTEEGSSGAPIFNQQKLVVGALSVGSSYCSKPQDPDFFGKLNYSWDNQPDSSNRLDVWLDPIETGELNIPGSYFPCDDSTLQFIPSNEIKVYPNPASAKVSLYVEQKVSSEINLEIVSSAGQTIRSVVYKKTNLLLEEIDLNSLSSGVYFFLISTNGEITTKKVVLLKP